MIVSYSGTGRLNQLDASDLRLHLGRNDGGRIRQS